MIIWSCLILRIRRMLTSPRIMHSCFKRRVILAQCDIFIFIFLMTSENANMSIVRLRRFRFLMAKNRCSTFLNGILCIRRRKWRGFHSWFIYVLLLANAKEISRFIFMLYWLLRLPFLFQFTLKLQKFNFQDTLSSIYLLVELVLDSIKLTAFDFVLVIS